MSKLGKIFLAKWVIEDLSRKGAKRYGFLKRFFCAFAREVFFFSEASEPVLLSAVTISHSFLCVFGPLREKYFFEALRVLFVQSSIYCPLNQMRSVSLDVRLVG